MSDHPAASSEPPIYVDRSTQPQIPRLKAGDELFPTS
jgi:hypothetical protein